MPPTPDQYKNPEDAFSFFSTHATLREALEAFLVAARGGAGALSLFEVLELVKDLLIFLADFVSQPHYDYPLENPDIQVSETQTDQKDQRTYGTITQKVRFRNVPVLKPGNSLVQRWFWNLFGKLHDLQQDEDAFSGLLKGIYAKKQGESPTPGSSEPDEEVPSGVSDEGNLVPFLAAKLRRVARLVRSSSRKRGKNP